MKGRRIFEMGFDKSVYRSFQEVSLHFTDLKRVNIYSFAKSLTLWQVTDKTFFGVGEQF